MSHSNSMEGFNNQQGASNRDVEGIKGEGVTTAAAEVDGEADAHTIRTNTHSEAFPNMSPRWEDPSKIIYPVSTTVALSWLSRGDSQPAEAATKTHRTQTDTNYNNWNVCYSHGFDVEDGHNSATCGNRKMDHQNWFTRDNAQAYIDAGYAPTTRGLH